MSQIDPQNMRKDDIPSLVEILKIRSDQTYIEIREKMADYLKWPDYDDDRFNRKFRRESKAAHQRYDVKELLALVNAFVTDLPPEKGCSADEALRLFSLARLPLDAFRHLRAFFSEKAYRSAWEPYLQASNSSTSAPVEEPTKDTNFLKPFYPQVFIGRNRDIDYLKERLGAMLNISGHPLTVVRGWPGVGKTTLVNRLIYDARKDLQLVFPDGILWTSLGPDGDILYALKRWALQIGAVHIELLQRLEDVVEQMRYALQDRHILLVIDDVWDQKQGSIFKQLGSPQTTFLFTTRFTTLAYWIGERPENVHFLDVLTTQQSLELMHVFAPRASSVYAKEMVRLVETLEGLPLALRVAGTLVENEFMLGFDVVALIDELQNNFSLYKDVAPAGRFDEGAGQTPTIGMLFLRSVQTLTLPEQEAFACMGGFAPKPAAFDLRAIAGVCGLSDPAGTARSLVARGLLEPLGNARFQMHYTLSMYARYLLENGLDDVTA